jgi:uncharacterized membrane protein YedE/YeeE
VEKPASGRPEFIISLAVLCAATMAAYATGAWVFTAIPVGFLFGFFLQKGDLCGASAFSEVVLARDTQKVFGIWIAIVVAMVGFALIGSLGWVRLAPKPMLWASYLVGGIVFGVGTVLAGGCVSGCLFKAGAGNLNSMAALAGMPLGIALIEYGPLNVVHRQLMTYVVRSESGGPVTLSSLTGLPFWVLAIAMALLTGAWLVWHRPRRRPQAPGASHSTTAGLLTRPWRPWQAGLAIGLLAIPGYLSSAASGRNYPLGVTHGVLQAYIALTETHIVHVWRPQPAPRPSAPPVPPSAAASTASRPAPAVPPKPVNWWLVAIVASMVPGAWVAARLSGVARLARREPVETVVAFFGGILVGAGAALATGCVVGNILSGWALMSVGLVVFGVVTILANWVTTYVYLMGGRFDRASLRAVLARREEGGRVAAGRD